MGVLPGVAMVRVDVVRLVRNVAGGEGEQSAGGEHAWLMSLVFDDYFDESLSISFPLAFEQRKKTKNPFKMTILTMAMATAAAISITACEKGPCGPGNDRCAQHGSTKLKYGPTGRSGGGAGRVVARKKSPQFAPGPLRYRSTVGGRAIPPAEARF